MNVQAFLSGKVDLHAGDCLAVLPLLAENSIDSCVVDPPYHLTAGKNGGTGAASLNEHSPAGRARISTGFMGKAWDGGYIAFDPDTWRAVYRVLKPGAHLLAFGGTRTYHRMACAIEDAGFEIRDCIQWLYGSGFPKSLDISKAIDKAAGAQGRYGAKKPNVHSRGDHVLHEGWRRPWMDNPEAINNSGREYLPATPDAAQWSGFGTALKPACEPIVLARKPLSEKTVAANVLKWGTGALNVDRCRVGVRERPKTTDPKHGGHTHNTYGKPSGGGRLLPDARWPANVITDGSDEVVGMFPEDAGANGGNGSFRQHAWMQSETPQAIAREKGSAARFFYAAKADSYARIGSKHPTVKPLDLIQYLVRLVTPPGGTVLDCFAGTGTTGEAAFREGFRAILIEREAEYCDDIRRRMALVLAGPEERARESIKARTKDKPAEHGPLFAVQP